MKTFVWITALATVGSTALASRELITCRGTGTNKGYVAKLDFDPKTALDTVWENNSILTYKNGSEDSSKARPPVTTARVSLTVPTTAWKKPYSGTFRFSDFYEVNTLGSASETFENEFQGKPYRAFHGHDKDQKWDMMIYFPDDVLGREDGDFPGITSIQNDLMDEGYYFIDLECSSKLK